MATRRERSLQKAEKLVQRGRLEAAIDELRKVLKESPDDTRTLNRVGDLYARLSRVDEAVELFSQAAERFTKEGFFVKAIAIYKKILRLDPTRMPIYDSLAELYRHQGLTNEARAQYQVVADYYEKAEDIAAVVAVYEKLVELDLEDPEMRLRLGELLTAADRLDEAADQYKRAAVVLLEGGEPEAAFRVLERAIETDPKNLEFIMKTVLELRDGSAPELAERFVDAAIAANPEASPARELLESVAAEEEVATEPEPEAEAEAAPEPEPELETALEAAAEAVEETVEPEAAESEEFEIELDAFEEAAAAPPAAAPPEAREPEAEPEPAAVEEVAPAAEPAPEIDLDDVLIEADALASYGLADKAVVRLEAVLDHAPGHLGAYRRLIAIRADERRDVEVVQLASRAATSALESGSAAAWREIVGDLTRRGYRIEGSKIIPPAPPELEVPEELFVDAADAGESAPAVETEEAPKQPAETLVETAEPAEAAEDEDDWLDRLTEHRPEEAEAAPPAAPLEDDAPAPVTTAREGGEGFFDLGAELAEELEAMEEGLADVTPHEADSVEEIVAGFKRGMAEVLSPEAYDTHYSLGVAYREMGLVDEAIGEFQLAAKDPRYLVECCSLLGQCFQEKDFSDLAIKWYRKGLDSPYISEEETLGLLYELGNLYLANGDRDAARKVFTEIYGSNSNFRDVVAKLEELRGDR